MGEGRKGVSPSGPVESNRGVRAHVRAAGKALEGDDRQTGDLTITVRFVQFYSVSQNPPPDFFLTFFPKRLGIIFSPNFTCLLLVPIYMYTGLQIFIQLSATLTKLCRNKRDHRNVLKMSTIG